MNVRDTNQSMEFIPKILRDSADCLIGASGNIVFSSGMIGDTISYWTQVAGSTNDTLYEMYYIMQGSSPLTVPAGTFDVLDRKSSIYSDLFDPQVNQPFTYHNYFSKDIGLVSFSYIYVSSTNEMRHTLVDYYVQ